MPPSNSHRDMALLVYGSILAFNGKFALKVLLPCGTLLSITCSLVKNKCPNSLLPILLRPGYLLDDS